MFGRLVDLRCASLTVESEAGSHDILSVHVERGGIVRLIADDAGVSDPLPCRLVERLRQGPGHAGV
jgi:hypothetical protein